MAEEKKMDKEIRGEERQKIEQKFKEIEKKIKEDDISTSQLYEWFKEEIDRKDKEIEILRKDNHALFMTAIKANQRNLDTNLVSKDNKDK